MTTSAKENQRGIQHWDLITSQFEPHEKKEKIEDQTQPCAGGPHTFIKYLRDYYESLDSLFVNPVSGPEQSRTN